MRSDQLPPDAGLTTDLPGHEYSLPSPSIPNVPPSALGYLHDDGLGTRVWRIITSSDVTTALGFTPYNATNPAGYITSAGVPVAYTSTPTMNGVGAAGSSAAWAKGDHVHPVDTSRQAALGFTPINKAGDSGIGGLSGTYHVDAGTTTVSGSFYMSDGGANYGVMGRTGAGTWGLGYTGSSPGTGTMTAVISWTTAAVTVSKVTNFDLASGGQVFSFKVAGTQKGYLYCDAAEMDFGPTVNIPIYFTQNGITRFALNASGGIAFAATTLIGFFGATPATKPTVTGSRGGNAALASLLTALASLGLLTDSSTV